jgi:hypothetical protein
VRVCLLSLRVSALIEKHTRRIMQTQTHTHKSKEGEMLTACGNQQDNHNNNKTEKKKNTHKPGMTAHSIKENSHGTRKPRSAACRAETSQQKRADLTQTNDYHIFRRVEEG